MGHWGVVAAVAAAAVVAAVLPCSWTRAWPAGCWGSLLASSPCHRAAAPQERAGSCRAAMTHTHGKFYFH